ncbi:hypothetical protein C5167_047193 [Papaver somniferum]|uniref:Uncharacterized protein n=1 Tax=Papaver somniferum TaxID=3469 RepID=A0A4Y7LHF1_PAPSO|nr:hypothetical protein C5167_047193 [Papaver somniferum]
MGRSTRKTSRRLLQTNSHKERFSDSGHGNNSNNKVIGQGYFGNWVKKNSSSFKGFGGQIVNGGGVGDENFTKVKITRFRRRRRGSFLSLINTSSQFWASIYGAVKQLVPWKRRNINRQLKRREEEEEAGEDSRNKLSFTTV